MKKHFFRAVILLIVTLMSQSMVSAENAGCVFVKKNSEKKTEITELVSGKVYVYAPPDFVVAKENKMNAGTIKLYDNSTSEELTPADEMTAAALFDGNVDTNIHPSNNERRWNLQVILDKEIMIDNMDVTFGIRTYPTGYKIEASADSEEWVLLKADENNTTGGVVHIDFEMQTVKYIRITSNKRDTMMHVCELASYGASISKKAVLVAGLFNKSLDKMYEIDYKEIDSSMSLEEANVMINVDEELVGLPEERPEKINLATGAEVKFFENNSTKELQPSGSAYASNANDGNLNTVACAGGQWAYTLQLDLKEEKSVGQVVLYFAADNFPLEFDILTSKDGVEWTIVKSVTNNADGGMHELTFDPVRARYIRVRDNVAQIDTRKQMRIQEIEVYEKSYDTDFEVRAFMLNDLESKIPYDGKIYVLN